jgi:hypothetical protein
VRAGPAAAGGIRQDTFANEHRIKVEEEKPRAEEELIARR